MFGGLSFFVYIIYSLPLVTSAWYIWLFFRKRKQGRRLALYPVFILLAPFLFLIIWFLLLFTISNIFYSVGSINSIYQELAEKILIFWLPISFLLGLPLVALILAVVNIRKRQYWAGLVLTVAFIYGLIFTIPLTLPNIPINSVRDALVYLSKKLVVPDRVELELAPTALELYVVLGSGCNTGGTPLVTEVQIQKRDIRINILGHKFFRPEGLCQAIIFSNAEIAIQDSWFIEQDEIDIDFVLSGKRNLYHLKKIEEKPELFKFSLTPARAVNVISGGFGYNPPLEAVPVEAYINLGEYNRRWYDKALKTMDWNLCKNIIDNKYQTSDCLEKIAIKLNDWKICQQDPDQTYREFCTDKFIPKIIDLVGCKIFPYPSNIQCYRALAIRFKNVNICRSIDYQKGINWCLVQYVMRFKDKSICNQITDKVDYDLCLWHARP
ncbi:MAG: hypothetical protein A2998_03185 [Candidatus Staskawiczbacteria bacterium RIFCSPLOWO2_01_FULL_37_25b]|uniref:Uncharacterized protein n=2 Tax=Parcubacteria group TaxID=1794811 RepID=A0A1G2ID08_9BACT|nr:MAG: hypothetical protein A2819_00920 [Candidatus Azambacteria bacterium RIFCSPHIGHO2_01_FULL_40_24]OGZ72632.1 MAG: hypothetical protein A2998_03185 [Candidatus Staskawiczbacteria bacterium RIFCSPLOWO2_01_FULL_37_25b]